MSTNQSVVAPVNDREVVPPLTSWKDIAQYVGKGIRTVQRWERELGFPVRRTNRAQKGVVLAIPREIDTWVKAQQFSDTGRSDRETLPPVSSSIAERKWRASIRESRASERTRKPATWISNDERRCVAQALVLLA
jgi:hypothetical protein